jgi:glycosyltransferase involved in cell wall biosynthesis
MGPDAEQFGSVQLWTNAIETHVPAATSRVAMSQYTPADASDGTAPPGSANVAQDIRIPTSRRPKLLFLCHKLPYPTTSGARLRSYNVLRILARHFDVTALFFYRKVEHADEKEVQDALRALGRFAHVEAFPTPQDHSRARFGADHLRSLLSRTAYTRFVYASRSFSARLGELLRSSRFDLVHVDSLDLAGYLPAIGSLPVVCTHHNVESALLERRARSERSPLLRRYIAMQAGLLRKEERRWCPRVSLNIAVSEADHHGLREIAPTGRYFVVPNGVDTDVFRPASGPQDGIVFVGPHSWYPNRDAMEYFSREILPLLRARHPDVPVRWVGRASDETRRLYRDEYGVELTGYVDDVQPHVHSAACYVVPLRVGGGTRLKIVDAWAMGKAMVSTSIGCEGLDARDGENILIRDTPEAFAAAVESVLTDGELRRRLEAGARMTAERVYDWDVIGEQMVPQYMSLLTQPR